MMWFVLICWLLVAVATYWNTRRLWKKNGNHSCTNKEAMQLAFLCLIAWLTVLGITLIESDWFDREAKW